MTDYSTIPRDARWLCRAYYPPNEGGGIAIETWHTTEGSLAAEVGAFESRIKRGDLSHVEIVDRERPFDAPRILR